MLSLKTTNELAKLLKLNLNVINPIVWNYGVNVELEHGTRFKKTNVTNNDLLMTAKIALVHIMEFPDYYERLYKLENDAKKYWKNKKKLNLFK